VYDDEEYVEVLIYMAVPILWGDGKAKAAISIAVPKTRLTEDVKSRYIELLKNSARKITGRPN
jgi:DNA-binding IclR family transcriptional regulator